MGSRSRSLAYLALVVQTSISAGTYLLGKRALMEIPPLALVMLRNIGATLCLVLIAAATVRPLLPHRKLWWRVAALGVIAVPINQGAFVSGLSRSTPTHAALLYTLTPLFVFLISASMGIERPGAGKILGLAIALGGAALVVFGGRTASLVGGSMLGDLLMLCGVMAWATYTVVGKPLVREAGPVAASAWSLTFGTIAFLPVGLPRAARVNYAHVSATAWGGLAFLILMTSVVSYLCWYYALRELEPSRVAVFTNLQPVTTALASWAVFGEVITSNLLLGGALVIAGVVVTTRVGNSRRVAALATSQ